MGVTLALPKLYDDVETLLADEAAASSPPTTPVPMAFGWRAPAYRGVSHRIVWVPGDDSNGNLGDLAVAREPGRNPRPLWRLGELFTVYLEAFDAASPEDERAQYQAARELFDTWARAIYRVARGTIAVRNVSWVTDKKVRRFGATLRVLAMVDAMVPDLPSDIAPVDTSATVTAYPSATSDAEPETEVVDPA